MLAGGCERGGAPCAEDSECGAEGERCFRGHCVDEQSLAERAAWACRWGLEGVWYGRRTAVEGGCVATEDVGCAASQVSCKAWGQCSAPPEGWSPSGACPPTSLEDLDYQASSDPRCAGRGMCIAASDEQCRAARVCVEAGRCVARRGICVADSADDCMASRLCTENGLCSFVGGRCQAGGDQDCLRSKACDTFGDCRAARGRCVGGQ